MERRIFSESDWTRAKDEARSVLVEYAKARRMIPYGELARRITAVEFEPHDALFFKLLGEVSPAEFESGRGMLTALVVHRDGDMQPGPGFFDLARELGLDVADPLACWVEQFKKVHRVWRQQPTKRG